MAGYWIKLNKQRWRVVASNLNKSEATIVAGKQRKRGSAVRARIVKRRGYYIVAMRHQFY